MTKGRKHTEKEIIEGIKQAWEAGVDLRTSAIQKDPYRWLYRSHHYYFDSWRNALGRAGLSYEVVKARIENPRKEKEKQFYLQELHKAYGNGMDLSASSLQRNKGYSISLYERGKRFYKGRFFWETALEEAGLPVEKIVKQRRWDKEKVKARFIKRNQADKLINSSAVQSDETDLYKAIVNHFDSYDEALRYAGFNPNKIRCHGKVRSQRDIIMEIIKFHTKGKDLNRTNILKGRNKKLKHLIYSADRKFSKGWEDAVNAAGIDYNLYKQNVSKGYWNEDKVLEWIIELEKRGEPLNASYIQNKHNGLYHASIRYAHGWGESLKNCGINPEEIKLSGPSLSKKQIIEEIKCLYEKGKNLNAAEMDGNNDIKIRRVYHQAVSKFGCWENAIISAGLSYDQIRKTRKKYSLEELVKNVREFESQGMVLSTLNLRGNPKSKKIYHAVMHHFDSWSEFLDSIGIDHTIHTKTYWRNGENVLKYIRINFDTGVVTGASNDRNFAAAVSRYYESLPNAVELAGLIYSKSGKITREMLDNPKFVGILYKYNSEFLKNIAKRVYFGAKMRKLRTLTIEDLTNEAFVKLIEILPQKPPKKGIRQFCYWTIVKDLIKLNKKYFKEITFGEEVFLDLFKDDSYE